RRAEHIELPVANDPGFWIALARRPARHRARAIAAELGRIALGIGREQVAMPGAREVVAPFIPVVAELRIAPDGLSVGEIGDRIVALQDHAPGGVLAERRNTEEHADDRHG